VVILLAALVAVARRRRWHPALAVAVMAALVFQVLTLLQPPWPIGIALVAWLMLSLWWRGAQFPFGLPGNRRRYRISSARLAGGIV
jgi:hypothetical protein